VRCKNHKDFSAVHPNTVANGFSVQTLFLVRCKNHKDFSVLHPNTVANGSATAAANSFTAFSELRLEKSIYSLYKKSQHEELKTI
jgi:hypothetical protein